MHANKMFIQDIVSGILDRHIPFVDTISPLLHHDPIKASDAIIRLLDKAINKLCRYLPMMRAEDITLEDDKHTFTDNYFLYAKDEITDPKKIELIPMSIASLSSGIYSITSNYWTYDVPTLYATPGTYHMKAVYKYPVYIERDSNGLIKANSHVFGISEDIKSQFNNIIDLTFLKSIESRANLVKLPVTVDYFNLQEILQELSAEVEEDVVTSASMACAWGTS